jgi:hypothetical protein
MSDFFDSVLSGPENVPSSFLGQNYRYQDHIKTPQELGMSSEGTISAMVNDIGGLVGYVQLLVAGGGSATKGPQSGPLGDRFFLKTGAQCTDINTGEKVDRYVYIDNVPDGSIPFVSTSLNGVKFDSMKGLVPGILTNMSRIEPTKIFGAFMMGTDPPCKEVTREIIDENGNSSFGTYHLILSDIKEGFTSAVNKGTNNRGRAKKPYAPRHPYATMLPYGPDRPYDSTEQNAYKPLYQKEGPYVAKTAPLPSYVMPVAIVPDFKIDEIVEEKEEEKVVYAPDLTHKPHIATVPQIQKVIIKHEIVDDHVSRLPKMNKMPDDIYIQLYYSSLGLLGLYIFLKLFERKDM